MVIAGGSAFDMAETLAMTSDERPEMGLATMAVGMAMVMVVAPSLGGAGPGAKAARPTCTNS